MPIHMQSAATGVTKTIDESEQAYVHNAGNPLVQVTYGNVTDNGTNVILMS